MIHTWDVSIYAIMYIRAKLMVTMEEGLLRIDLLEKIYSKKIFFQWCSQSVWKWMCIWRIRTIESWSNNRVGYKGISYAGLQITSLLTKVSAIQHSCQRIGKWQLTSFPALSLSLRDNKKNHLNHLRIQETFIVNISSYIHHYLIKVYIFWKLIKFPICSL